MSPRNVAREGIQLSFSVRCIPGDMSPEKPIPGDKSPGFSEIVAGENDTGENEGECYCPINVVDSLDGRCGRGYLNYDTFFMKTGTGRNPLPYFYIAAHTNAGSFNPSTAFQSYPKDVTGVMALSTSPYALPAYFNQQPLNITFSLCIPSASAAPGMLFYGNGPYYFLPHSDVDVMSFLSYTPLLIYPNSFGYFIGVNSIVIKKRPVDLPGNTTAMLSTTEPYTTLRTHIYNPVARRGNVACLAFVDSGAKSEHAIVIGTHQFEDNFLLFDLENSSFVISSSLLRPISCEEFECTEVRTSYSYNSPSCPPINNSSTLPGWGYCTCPVNVMNPVNGKCTQSELNIDRFAANSSDGRNSFLAYHGINLHAACAPSSSFESFPKNVSGVMAFSASRYALPAYYYQSWIKTSLALCLPSTTSSPGVLFFGEGPFYLLPHSEVDIRSLLSYTPLLKRPDSFSYYIGVNAIVIKQRSFEVVENTTARLSTTEPYTMLKTDIYHWVVRRLSKVTRRMPLANPVAPFSLCYRMFFDNGTRVDLSVPDIDFSLQDGKNWTITKDNSIRHITKDVACLAFVDGGATTEQAIVIGTFQMMDNFLLFDLENSTFGFKVIIISDDDISLDVDTSNEDLMTFLVGRDLDWQFPKQPEEGYPKPQSASTSRVSNPKRKAKKLSQDKDSQEEAVGELNSTLDNILEKLSQDPVEMPKEPVKHRLDDSMDDHFFGFLYDTNDDASIREVVEEVIERAKDQNEVLPDLLFDQEVAYEFVGDEEVVETSSQVLVTTSKSSRDDVRILIDDVKLTDLEVARRRFAD
nr:basic 7S globulin-like [Tanacetum cinerariifolium]